jgi:hypothetical protein
MRRGLYVLFEGLADTVIDSQVLVHAREMRALGIADFEVWSFAWSGPLYARSQARLAEAQRLAGGPVHVLRGFRPGLPFSPVLNARLIGRALSGERPTFDLVHARTDYSADVCARLRRSSSFDLVWDCRGDMVAEVSERRARVPMAARIGRRLARARRRQTAAACDRAIFVSEALREEVAFVGKPFEIIPCSASEEMFFFDQRLRAETRRELGYDADARVLVYSGSLAPYQCFAESAALFRRLREADPRLRLLVLTPEVDHAKRMLLGVVKGSFDVRYASLERVNAQLNAADFGLMLRYPGGVNRVASPTKFAEYSLAGLPVIMTDAVLQSHALARRFDNLVLHRFDGIPDDFVVRTSEERRRIAAEAHLVVSRAACREAYRRLYSR